MGGLRAVYVHHVKPVIPQPVFSLYNWIKRKLGIKFTESKLAHKYLDGLSGLEIGGSAHNPFGLNTKNVDYTTETNYYKKLEEQAVGEKLPVDIVASGDALPLPDESQDFVVSAHVLEHFPDPIKALKEWYRVIRPGGYIFMIIPHKERTFDRDRPRTTLRELINRHAGKITAKPNPDDHYSVWVTADLVELINYLGWKLVRVEDVDDKSGHGFTIVIRK